jgi:hypothetical protein
VSSIALLGLHLVGACDFHTAAADIMPGANCSTFAMAGGCNTTSPLLPFFKYVCGTSCGVADIMQDSYTGAYEGVDLTSLFQQVEAYGLFTPDADYAYYANCVLALHPSVLCMLVLYHRYVSHPCSLRQPFELGLGHHLCSTRLPCEPSVLT